MIPFAYTSASVNCNKVFLIMFVDQLYNELVIVVSAIHKMKAQ